MGSNTYGYDANGNMTARAGATLSYDAENRLMEYSGGGVSAAFLYDGDGRRVKGVANTVTTLYVNDYYEIEGTTVRKYYSAGGQRIAVRENGVLSYLLADHLGSITVSLDGQNLTGTRSYSSWGETRGSAGTLPTARGYQGQYAEGELGLLFFNARWGDPQLGRFVSADSLVPEPGNPGDWDRYAFVLNNPIKGIDPSGHACMVFDGSDCMVNDDGSEVDKNSIEDPKSGEVNGWQIQFSAIAAFPINNIHNTKGEEINFALFYGISLVFDMDSGVQIFGITRDIEFAPRLVQGPAELNYPSKISGLGATLATGPVFGEGFNQENGGTNNYAEQAVDKVLGVGPISGDYYEAYDKRTGVTDAKWVSGVDIGYSWGFPFSFGTISTYAHPLSPRFEFPHR